MGMWLGGETSNKCVVGGGDIGWVCSEGRDTTWVCSEGRDTTWVCS